MARVVINHQAVRQLLREDALKVLEPAGERIRDAAGAEDHEVQVWQGNERARVTVRTATYRGRFREAKYRSLSHAIEAGRG